MTSKENYPAFVNFDRHKHIYLLSFIQMILRTDFADIDTEIKQAIKVTLNNLRVTNQNNYLLLLVDGI